LSLVGVLLAAILAPATPASSHGGGLDASGCHHNRKRGGYHCHRGEFTGQSFKSRDEMLKKLRERDGTKAPDRPAPPRPRREPVPR
jgi:hypothetical protein